MNWIQKNFGAKFFWIWAVALVVKLFLASLLPLAADENYYWVWGQNLRWSYFDHPAMIAWLLRLGSVFGNTFCVRWPIVLVGHMTYLVWGLILKNLSFSLEEVRAWLWLALVTPLIGFGSIMATPDVPFVFFWSLSFFFFLKRLQDPSRANFFDIALGLSLGLGFCSKYHIVLFLPFAVVYLSWRRRWSTFHLNSVLRIFVSGLVASAPVLIWNAQNDFGSFKFQLHHGLGEESWDPFWTYSYVFGQIFIVLPMIFWRALRTSWRRVQPALTVFTWGPILFFFASSFKALVELNWPIAAQPSLLALAVKSGLPRRWVQGTVLFFGISGFALLTHIFYPWIPGLPREFEEFSAYRDVPSLKKEFSPLFGSNYQMSSYVWFQTGHAFFKLRDMSRPDFFDTLEGSKPNTAQFFVVMKKDDQLPAWLQELKPTVKLAKVVSETLVVNEVDTP